MGPMSNDSRGKIWRLCAGILACLAALVSAFAAAGCSSTASPPAAWVTATLSDGMSTTCGENNVTWFNFQGTGSTESDPKSVSNGETYEGSAATVGCTVASSGSGYMMSGNVSVGVGSFTVSGMLTSSGTQSGLTASVTNGTAGGIAYSSTDCTMTYTSFNSMPVKAGAVWGTVICPTMTTGEPGVACEGTIQMQLTNCTQ
jgi:hypothetical protein